jgi:hypothetical protein
MDAAERALLAATVRDAVTAAGDDPRKVDAALFDVGWFDMLAAVTRDATTVVFGALGATNAPSSVLDDVIVSALGIEPRADLAVLLPPFGQWTASMQGIATARITTATEVVVISEAGAGLCARDAVTAAPIRGLDPDAGWHTALCVAVPEIVRASDAPWIEAVASGRRAVAQQISGACREMLTMACAHAVERVQFDRPIARFQAVRHRLADALVAVESLDAALDAAWDEPGATTAALAKALAGRTARTVAKECQQVLAGIGFTTDHAFHRYLKRTMMLDGMLGGADDIVTDLGRELIARRFVPTLIEL